MRNLRSLGGLLILALAGGCVTPSPWIEPLPPGTLDTSGQHRQQVTLERGDTRRSMQVAIETTPGQLTLIGLSALGQRLFTIEWDGTHIRSRAISEELDKLDPRWVLADLQLAFWPLPPLRRALPADLRLAAHGRTRTLWRGDDLLWFCSRTTDDPWQDPVMLYNGRGGYRLYIRPLDGGT